MSKDPMWIPKPPVLYGSDKLEVFQPYDPETPASASPPVSPSCPGSSLDSSSSSSATIPSLLTSISAAPVSGSFVVAATEEDSEEDTTTASSGKTPLQTILKTLFGDKQTESKLSSDGCPTKATSTALSDTKTAVFSQVSPSMVDPIVQQYGQKSKIKEIEQEGNDFDRPYDPEEEYDPSVGFGMVSLQNVGKKKADKAALSGFVEDDVAYDPEDETIFEDIQSDTVGKKPHIQTQTSDSGSSPAQLSTQVVAPIATFTPQQTCTPATVMANLPTGTIVVSAATLTEQQRMLEELNKQIEEQKRQLKEQEEALRQQREAVGMFMAHFSVSDSLMSPPSKSLPLSQKLNQAIEKSSNPTETMDPQTVKQGDLIADPNFKNDTNIEEDNSLENAVENADKYSSAGEIEDSDVAYDPEDESLFNEIQEDVFQGSSTSHGSSMSRVGHSVSRKGISPNSHHSRKSPKRRSHRERDHHRSPSRKSQRRSTSHSRRRRERDRHRKAERDRSRHRTRDQSERQARHRKEHTTHRFSRGHKRSPSSPRKKCSESLLPKQHTGHSPQVLEKSKHLSIACDAEASVGDQVYESDMSSSTPVTIKNDPDGRLAENVDKDTSSSSHELLHKLKLEISEPPKFPDIQKDTVIDHDNKGTGSFTQDDETTKLESLFNDKIESTIPLRELDPPIRDSPESPDPDPQFVKPSSTENNDFIKTEENIDGETHANVSMPFVKVEDFEKWDIRLIPSKGPDVRDQGLVEADIQSEGKSTNLKHPETFGSQGRHSESSRGFDIQGSELEKDPVKKCPEPSKSIGNSTSDMKERGQREPQTGIRFAGSDVKDLGIHGESSSTWGPAPHVKDPRTESDMKKTENLPLKTDITSSRSITEGSGMRSPMNAIETYNVKGIIQEQHPPEMRHHEQEIRGQDFGPPTNNSQLEHSDHMRGGVTYIGDGIGQSNRGKYPHGRVMRFMRGRGVRNQNPGPPFGGPRRVPRQSRYNDCPILEELGPKKRGFLSYEQNADISRVDGGQEWSLDSNACDSEDSVLGAQLSPAMSNDRLGPQREQSVSMSGPRPNISYQSGGSNMSCNRQYSIEHQAHFKDPQSDNTDVGEACPDWRNADIHEKNSQGPVLEWRNEQMGHRGPNPNIKHPQSRGPEGGGGDMGNLHWSGHVSDTRDDWRSTDRQRSHPAKGKSYIQNEWGVHQPNETKPNMENLGCDRETQISGFIAPGPHVPGHDSRGHGNPGFRRPKLDRKGPTVDILGPGMMGLGVEASKLGMEGPGTDGRGPGGPHFRAPGPVNKVPGMEGQGHDIRPPGPDFRRPWPERTHFDIVSTGTDRRCPGGQEVWGTAQQGPAMNDSGTDRREPVGPDFRGHQPTNRGLSMGVPGSNRERPGCPDFRGPEGPGNDSMEFGSTNLWGQGPENRAPPMEGPQPNIGGPGGTEFIGPGPDRRRPGDPDFTGPGSDRRGPAVGSLGPDIRGPGHKRRGFPVDNTYPNKRRLGGPDFQGPGHENRGLGIDRPPPDRRGPGSLDLRQPECQKGGPSFEGQNQNEGGLDQERRPYIGGPGPDQLSLGPERTGLGIEGPGPHSSGRGRPHFRGSGSESRPNMEGPGSGRRGLGIRGPWLEGPNMDNLGSNRRGPEDNQSFPESPQFGSYEQERRHSDMQGTGPDRRGHHFRQFDPETTVMESQEKGPFGPNFRGPICENRGPKTIGSGPIREEPVGGEPGYDFSESGPERTGLNLEGPGPGWGRPGCPNFKHPGIRQKCQNLDGPQHDSRDKWGGSDCSAPKPMHGGSNLEGSGCERAGQPLRGLIPVRRNFRRPGANMSSQNCEDRWNSLDTHNQWTDGRGSNVEDAINETEGSEDHWKRHDNRGLDEQGQDQSRQGLHDDWRGPESRGAGPIQERSNIRGPEDDWSGSTYKGPRPGHDNPDIMCHGTNRRGPRNEWNDPHRGACEPHRMGPRPFFRGERNLDNAGQGQDRKQRAIRGPDMTGDPDIGNDWKQPNFRGYKRGPNIEGPDRGGPDLINLSPNERGFEMTGLNKRGPGGPDLRYSGPRNRISDTDGPGIGKRFSDGGGAGYESRDMDRRFESDFRRERRNPDMRKSGPEGSSNIRHVADRWNKNTDTPIMTGPGLNSDSLIKSDTQASDITGQRCNNREPLICDREHGQKGQTSNDRRGPGFKYLNKSASPHLNNPNVTTFKGPSHPHSVPFIRPSVPAPNSGGKLYPGFDHPQNQQSVKPQRQRAALLPTPTEGIIRFPN